MASVQGAIAPGLFADRRGYGVIDRCEPAITAFLLLCTAPLLICAGVVTVLLSRRSPFVRHWRVGRGGCPIGVLKLRTMWPRERASGGLPSLIDDVFSSDMPRAPRAGHDPRVTSAFASFCRRYSIDE